jgi:hypothetical protein
LLAAVSLCLSAAAADNNALPFVSLMFSDNMVLQRGKLNTVWGWLKPGDAVRVEIAGHTTVCPFSHISGTVKLCKRSGGAGGFPMD